MEEHALGVAPPTNCMNSIYLSSASMTRRKHWKIREQHAQAQPVVVERRRKKNRGAGTKGGHGHAWDVSEFAIE